MPTITIVADMGTTYVDESNSPAEIPASHAAQFEKLRRTPCTPENEALWVERANALADSLEDTYHKFVNVYNVTCRRIRKPSKFHKSPTWST